MSHGGSHEGGFEVALGWPLGGLPGGVIYADSLTSPGWHLLTVITNVRSSPYPYVCGRESGAGSQRYYRAVCSP